MNSDPRKSIWSSVEGVVALRRLRRFSRAAVIALVLGSLLAFALGVRAANPVGTPKGIFPGYVVWAQDFNAAQWPGTGDIMAASYNPQAEYNATFSAGIRGLSGGTNNADSWNRIFQWFNNNNGRPATGYQAGDGIAVKINCNNTTSSNMANAGTTINANPQSAYACVKSLVDAGVPQGDIWIGDPSREVTYDIVSAIHASYPSVNVVDYFGDQGCVLGTTTYKTGLFPNSDNWPSGQQSTCFYNARYLIAMPLMKGHGAPTLTFGQKLYFGTMGINVDYTKNTPHPNLADVDFAQFLTNSHWGGKTILWCMDAMYPSEVLNGTPDTGWEEFGNRPMSSFIMSLDACAEESVSFDFFSDHYTDSGWDDNYIDLAALGGGGVYEHWNNPTNRQYSGNLGGTNGITLIALTNYVPSPPNSPIGLTAGQGGGQVYLAWGASGSGASGYDVWRATNSNGPFTLIGSTATNVYEDTAVSSCATYCYEVSATNSAGQSSNSLPASVAMGSYALAVDCGGPAAGQFVADTDYSGGTSATAAGSIVTISGVTNPAPQEVYLTERYGNTFSYAFSNLTAGLTYQVRLHFAEIYWTATNQRVFNVAINGTKVLTNFDIFAVTGTNYKATIQQFNVQPSNGQIAVSFTTITDNAKCSGIEVLLPQTPAPSVANNGPIWAGTTLNLTASTVAGAAYTWTGPNGFTSTNQDPSITVATPNAAGTYSVVATVGGCASQAATTVAAVVPIPCVALAPARNGFTLSWPCGTLQTATNISGPWGDVAGATNGCSVLPTNSQQFFRVRPPQ